MVLSVWFISIIVLLFGDIIQAQQNNVTEQLRHCNSCDQSDNSTTCDTSVACPASQPFCVTVASSPDFTSSLRCVERSETSCVLLYSPAEKSHLITCICGTELCNRPFPEKFARELKEFSTLELKAVTNTTDVTDLFLRKTLPYVNVSRNDLFNKIFNKTVTINGKHKTIIKNVTKIVEAKNETAIEISKHDAPRAEALKQEVVSAPSDDEEDGEGSGAWGEDGRSPRRPSPAAAAPSSFLPAHENKGSSLFINLLVMIPFMLYVII